MYFSLDVVNEATSAAATVPLLVDAAHSWPIVAEQAVGKFN